MAVLKTCGWVLAASLSSMAYAADFEFDRPGESFSTTMTPVGQVAWEQGLPTLDYSESKTATGQSIKATTLNADVLLRTGLTNNLELQLGWMGPAWSKVKVAGKTIEDDGLGDVSIALKRAIDLDDDRLSMAVMAKAELATGNNGFSHEEDVYSIASAVSYQYDEILTTAINMRYEYEDSNWAIVAIPSLGYRFTDKWSGFSEFVYRKAESQDYESTLSSGLIYAVNDRMQLDASIGVDLHADEKSYHSGLGVAFLF